MSVVELLFFICFAPRVHFKTMDLLSFIVPVFLTLAFCGQIVGYIPEDDVEFQNIDEMPITGQYGRSRFNPKIMEYGNSAEKIPVLLKSFVDKSYFDKIIGGSLASYGEIPWQASIKFENSLGAWKHSCGAAIINHFWLVSAAHCYYADADLAWEVMVGEHHLFRGDSHEQTFSVDAIYVHPNFDIKTQDFDIALIRIRPSDNGQGIVYNKFVQPICLADSGLHLRTGTKLLISGWGGTLPCVECKQERQIYSPMLMKAIIPVVDRAECRRIYRRVSVTRRMICAGYKHKQIDTCLGDSGGPAVYKIAGNYVLYGIVSWGDGCAQPGKVGVYTRAADFISWIGAIVKGRSSTARRVLWREIPLKQRCFF